MKKVIIELCMFLLPLTFVYSQTEVDTIKTEVESDCESSLKNIFKVHELKIKYETVDYIYKYREGGNFFKNQLFQKDSFLNRYFKSIRGVPFYEEQKDSISVAEPGRLVKVEFMSKEEMNGYLEQLNYTPEEAYKDYKDFIQIIKLEREVYLKCIDAELAKGDASEYVKDKIYYYDFLDPRHPLGPHPADIITKLEFLKVFKEFILMDDDGYLPNLWRVKAYLKCGCKI